MFNGITHPYRIEGAKLRVKSGKNLHLLYKRKSPVVIPGISFYCLATLSIHLDMCPQRLNSSSTFM
jgi:hypothetical protein